ALVAKWTGLGFVHGVLNTDNLSVLGLTIDYGPYGWLDRYTPGWTPNTSDHGGRYRFEQQAAVAQWNLAQLGNALYLVVEDAPALQAILNDFETHYRRYWQDEMAAKLGLSRFEPRDEGLVSELLGLMEEAQVDPTLCFRYLADVPAIEAVRTSAPRGAALMEALAPCFYDDAPLDLTRREPWEAWLLRYGARLHADPADPATRQERMNGKNPALIPRNYLTQQAIDGLAEGDEAPLQRLLAGLRRPYAPTAEDAPLLGRRPAWAEAHPGCTALSCSS
ncbi:MAG: protein adenylyltransferase SelO family protein, partial [Pseudomonadales bacterium]